MLVRALCVFLLFALAPAHAQDATCDAHCKIDALLNRPAGIRLDKRITLKALKKFAPVISERTETRPNPNFPGQNDTIHAIAYEGLIVRAAVTPENRVLVEWVQQTGRKYPLPYGLKLGPLENPREVQAVLGMPDRVRRGTVRNGEQLVYSNEEKTESVTFVLQGGALKAINWNYGGAD
jgi:hypothetical protein